MKGCPKRRPSLGWGRGGVGGFGIWDWEIIFRRSQISRTKLEPWAYPCTADGNPEFWFGRSPVSISDNQLNPRSMLLRRLFFSGDSYVQLPSSWLFWSRIGGLVVRERYPQSKSKSTNPNHPFKGNLISCVQPRARFWARSLASAPKPDTRILIGSNPLASLD